ncbi:hypothetical protein G6F57_016418 [Rhizopus arrhizus]|nr:hypothetical protein G6F57_016418 [Rhizopus arrhizus]
MRGTTNPTVQSTRIGWNGTNSRHSARLTVYCNGITSMGACFTRVCRMAPAVMLASAAKANAMPATEKRAMPMLWYTTITRPHSARNSPASRAGE